MRGGGATDILGGPTKVKPTYIFVCKICILFFKYGFNAIKEPGHAKVLHTTNRYEESHGRLYAVQYSYSTAPTQLEETNIIMFTIFLLPLR